MSDVTPILTSVVDIKRFTAFVLDQQNVANSLNASRQPVTQGNFEITLAGCTFSNGAFVNMVGNVSEQINFSANGAKVGIQNFSSFVGASLSGIYGGTVKIRAVSDMGQPLNQLEVVIAGLSSRFFQQTGTMVDGKQGEQVFAKRLRTGLMTEPNIDIQVNDQIWSDIGMVGFTMFTVDFVEAIFDFGASLLAPVGSTHHIEAWLLPI